ncbi:hypothetical protein Neosp_013773 [[Neocosmospora] mangrovei]
MRGLSKAAAVLLAPALALAHGPHHPPPPPPPPPMGFLPDALDVTPSAFVTLKVPWGENENYPLTLRLDVEESEDVCGPANVRLNGEKLTQDAAGHGVGSFYLNNDTIISAEWDFECIGPREMPFAQSLRFNVRALDDMALSTDASFWMTFKQTAPIRIADVGNAAYVWSLSMPFASKEDAQIPVENNDDETNAPPIWEHPHYEFQDPEEELQVELMELNALHKQILELESLVKEREASVSKKLGKKYPPPPPSTMKMIKQCDGVKCVVHTLTDKVKHTAHRLYGSIFGHHGPHHPHGPHGPHHHGNGTHHGGPPHHPPPFPGGHPPPPPMCMPCECAPHHGPPPPPPRKPEHPPEHRPHEGGKEHAMASEHGHHEHGPHHHHDGPPPHNPIVMIFGMGAIALAIFCGICIAWIHRRVNRLSPESRRAIRRALRKDRRTRRASRPTSAFKAAIRAFFTHNDEDEEKEAMLREGRRRRSSSAGSVTMEQEIAQFREAACMVEGLVTAEEGRTHYHPQPHSYAPAVPPRPPMPPHHTAATAYPGFVTDENLPSYDDPQHDASVVTDGCRYTPGSSDYTPSNTASNADNVLGDSKH